jgi:putative SOS response-associated peptidase YedK
VCGRYSLHDLPEVIALQFGVGALPSLRPRYNIPPGTPVLAIHAGHGAAREAAMLHWGLVPPWAKDRSIGNRMNNARAESVADKPAFRAAFRRRRCILPASGFYEWKAVDGRKQPYYVRSATDGDLLGMAGLYEDWTGPDGVLRSCAVITTEPNAVMRAIHDRMPVILPRDAYAEWLDPGNRDPAPLQRLLVPCDPVQIRAHPVSTRVSRIGHDDPQLMDPVELPPVAASGPVAPPQGSLF